MHGHYLPLYITSDEQASLLERILPGNHAGTDDADAVLEIGQDDLRILIDKAEGVFDDCRAHRLQQIVTHRRE